VHQAKGADDEATYPNNDQQFCHLLILSTDDSLNGALNTLP
jgi:hypothetical protein